MLWGTDGLTQYAPRGTLVGEAEVAEVVEVPEHPESRLGSAETVEVRMTTSSSDKRRQTLCTRDH